MSRSRSIIKTLLLVLALFLCLSGNGYSKAENDFNSDNRTDVLWYNIDSGDVVTWAMNGKAVSKVSVLATGRELMWQIVGTGDFDKDGVTDILWQNTSTGEVSVWLKNGSQKVSIVTFAGTKWEVKAIGDFDGDGKSDILWQDKTTGDICLWLMNGGTIKTNQEISFSALSGWEVKAVGDFDGDGNSDILWRHSSTYAIAIWFMNGVKVKSATPSAQVGSEWLIRGIADFDGDGKSDIMWQNSNTGMLYTWLMDGTKVKPSSGIPVTPEKIQQISLTTWRIQDIGDFDGNGKSDILWYNPSTNEFAVWLMDGVSIKDYGFTTKLDKGSWKSIPSGSNIIPLFNTGISASNLSPTQGYSATAVTIKGSGFTNKSQVTFGSYAVKDVSFVSENELVVYVPFAVIGGKVSGLPKGAYAVSVDGKNVGSFSALALPDNPNPSGAVLKDTVSAMTDNFVASKESIQSGIATVKSSTTDANLIAFLDQMSGVLPDLETFLRNGASDNIDEIDPATLAVIEQTILANNRALNFKAASPAKPQGSLPNKSTARGTGKKCDDIGGDKWLLDRTDVTTGIFAYETGDAVLTICGFVADPRWACACQVTEAISKITWASKFFELAEYGSFNGITLDADIGKVGIPTQSALTLELAPDETSQLKASIRTADDIDSELAKLLSLISSIDSLISSTSCNRPSLFQKIHILGELASKVSHPDSQNEKVCPVSFSKVERASPEPKFLYGYLLSVEDNGNISWADKTGKRQSRLDSAMTYFRVKPTYLTLREKLLIDHYAVIVKNYAKSGPVLEVDKASGNVGDTFNFTGRYFTKSGSVEFSITGSEGSDVGYDVMTLTADDKGQVSYAYKPTSAGTYTMSAKDLKTGARTSNVSITVAGSNGKRFKDNGDGSMTDTYTGLQWMKKADGCNGYVTWDVANTCVPSGWRLPTIQELYTLCREDGTTTGLDLNATNWYYCNGHAVDRTTQLRDDGFDVLTILYWSSTTLASDTSYAWFVHMGYGLVLANGKSHSYIYVWPVRSGH
ncbi:MAG: VCBS repeat-containing protein [Nitrospirae bacterium]|nr:VCBS repeat-containing protein [Nitrospirota bacterium]